MRSFLGVSSKGVNKGIRDSLRDHPDRFMAYTTALL
ncbi:AIPR family protein [Halopseudomonas pachastrellae]|nr:AIPR family protein [Halopseudomonas pachastrellae]